MRTPAQEKTYQTRRDRRRRDRIDRTPVYLRMLAKAKEERMLAKEEAKAPPPVVDGRACRTCGERFDAKATARLVCETCLEEISYSEARRLERREKEHVQKSRKCLGCGLKFLSPWAGRRLCGSCGISRAPTDHSVNPPS